MHNECKATFCVSDVVKSWENCLFPFLPKTARMGGLVCELIPCRTTILLNSDFLRGVLLFFLEGDSKDTVFKLGFNRTFFFFDWNRESDGAREFAPVTLLDVPSSGIFIFPAAQNAGNCQDVVGNSHVQVGFGNAGRACFNN